MLRCSASSNRSLTLLGILTLPMNRVGAPIGVFSPGTRRGSVGLRVMFEPPRLDRFYVVRRVRTRQRLTTGNHALLRRQAVYLLGFDGRPEVVEWLHGEWNRTRRRRIRHDDITGLLEARSASVALAVAGDSSYLYDFVSQMTEGRADVANLNYWAYWIGKLRDKQISDDFMMDADTRSWTDARLLQHIVHRLEPDSTHLPLNLYTLHALIASRPSLLGGPPHARMSLIEVLDKLASVDALSRTCRDHLAGLQYAMRIADR